ncbi:Uncharacterised protein [Mycobacteroides abscessus subsp. abscessus]|nr:Uncharacterised protein [Mycobacteroides abscessus subsp. abscessus]
MEFNPHARKNITAAFHHIFFHFKFWNTKGQQATNFRAFVKDHWFDAITHQDIGTAQTCRACTNNRNFFIGPFHMRHIWTPTQGKSSIVNVLFGIANGHCTKTII